MTTTIIIYYIYTVIYYNSHDTSITLIVADAMWPPNSLKTDIQKRVWFGSTLLYVKC